MVVVGVLLVVLVRLHAGSLVLRLAGQGPQVCRSAPHRPKHLLLRPQSLRQGQLPARHHHSLGGLDHLSGPLGVAAQPVLGLPERSVPLCSSGIGDLLLQQAVRQPRSAALTQGPLSEPRPATGERGGHRRCGRVARRRPSPAPGPCVCGRTGSRCPGSPTYGGGGGGGEGRGGARVQSQVNSTSKCVCGGTKSSIVLIGLTNETAPALL